MSLRPLAALAACLVLAACATPHGPERSAPSAVELPPEFVAEGRDHARTFVEVVSRVEPVAESECRRHNPGADCDFLVVVDDRTWMPPNAFQTLDTNGRPVLAFTTQLIAAVRNPDELAFVMAHEASHHIAGHLEQQDRNALAGAAAFGRLARQAEGATPASIREAEQLGAEVGARSFSKSIELEADRLGVLVAFEAGYNPILGAEFFLRLPDPGDRFMGTHPSNAERIATVRAAAREVGLR